jgi:hypothetical protein
LGYPLGLNFGEHHTVTNSTFSGNLASEGANIYCLTESTDGCGYPDSPALTLTNTILANGMANYLPAAENCNGRHSIFPNDGGYNISDDDSCGFLAANNSLSSTDPLLDPNGLPAANGSPSGLQDNGGPTMTIALMEESSAIDAIPTGLNGCATDIIEDQRGVMRPQNGDSDGTSGCDIGAFEKEDDIAPTASVTTSKKRSANATVAFSEAMVPASLMDDATDPVAQSSTSQAIVLLKGSATSTTVVPAKVKCTDPSCQTVILDPDVRLGKYKKYTVKVEGAADTDGLAVKDLMANELAQDRTRSYKTGAR